MEFKVLDFKNTDIMTEV